MDNLDLQVLATARDWTVAGHAVWLVNVIETWGSAPRPAGALLALRDDGQVAGSVSGGCVEDDLIDRMRHGERVTRPTLVTYGVTRDEAARFGLPCGGTLRLLQEPLQTLDWVDEVLTRTARHDVVIRQLDIASGRVYLETASGGQKSTAFSYDGVTLRTVYGPRWRLVMIGAGQLSRVLGSMAQALDFEVICCDPRDEYRLGWNLPGTRISREMPDDLVTALQLDAHSAVVALTHDPKLDDLALIEALKSPAFYVGALGSHRNSERRRSRLREFDLSAAQVDRLRAPIGLAIGSRTPAEIAVSVLAELIAVRTAMAARGGSADLARAAEAAIPTTRTLPGLAQVPV